ncbi:hypothetical protein [Kitasatospora sp. NBC_00039]
MDAGSIPVIADGRGVGAALALRRRPRTVREYGEFLLADNGRLSGR